jgi:hypothetical protein
MSAITPNADICLRCNIRRKGPILLKKSDYRLSPIFPASWVRFSDADAGGLIIHPGLNGATSKSICRGN